MAQTGALLLPIKSHTNAGFYAFNDVLISGDGESCYFRDDYKAGFDRVWMTDLTKAIDTTNPRLALNLASVSMELDMAVRGVSTAGNILLYTRLNAQAEPGQTTNGKNGIHLYSRDADATFHMAPTVTDPRIASPAVFRADPLQKTVLSGDGLWIFHICNSDWGPAPHNWGTTEAPYWGWKYSVNTDGEMRVWRLQAGGTPAEQAAAVQCWSLAGTLADPSSGYAAKCAMAADEYGRNVAFMAPARSDNKTALYVCRADGSQIRLAITDKLYPAAGMKMTPDGNWIAFGVELTTVDRRVCVMRTDGSFQRILPNPPPRYPGDGTVSMEQVAGLTADGTRVLLTVVDGSYSSHLRLWWTHRDEGGFKPLFSDARFDCGPGSAAQDGRMVGFISGGDYGTGVGAVLAVSGYGFQVNTTNDAPDADLLDGVADADLTKSGLQTSLRAAIQEANRWPGEDLISFSMPGGASTIGLADGLPLVTDAVVIDGTTQPGTGLVTLDGRQTASGADGLSVTADGCAFKGLTLSGFDHNGLITTSDIELKNMEFSDNGEWGLRAARQVDASGYLKVNRNGTGRDTLEQGGILMEGGDLFGGGAANVEIVLNKGDGIRSIRNGAVVSVRNAQIVSNSLHGIQLRGDLTLRSVCTVNGNRRTGIYNFGVQGIEADDLAVDGNGQWGVNTVGSLTINTRARVRSNGTTWDDQGGILIWSGFLMASEVNAFEVAGNRGDGIRLKTVGGDVDIHNAWVVGNLGHGIVSAGGVVCRGDAVVSTNDLGGIYCRGANGVTADRLEASGNGRWGIWARAALLVNDEVIANGNGDDSGDHGGIFLETGSLVGGNRLEAVGNSGPGIMLSDGDGDFFADNVTVVSNRADGVSVRGQVRCSGFNRVSANGGNGLVVAEPAQVELEGVEMIGNGKWGIRVVGPLDLYGVCRIDSNGTAGVRGERGGICVTGDEAAAADLERVSVTGNGGDGVRCDAVAATSEFRNARVTGNHGIGFNLAGSLVLDGGAVRDNRGGNFRVGGTATVGAGVDRGDTEGDNVSDAVEACAPNGGDGNQDGIADSQQGHVASFQALGNQYLTMATGVGGSLTALNCSEYFLAAENRPGLEFPLGLLEYRLVVPPAGLRRPVLAGSTVVVVELLLPSSVEVEGYYKNGPTPDIPSNHWYRFDYDGTTGAILQPGKVVLHFVDGGRGDDDLTVNGIIKDTGAPFVQNIVIDSIRPLPDGRMVLGLWAKRDRTHRVESSEDLRTWEEVVSTNAPSEHFDVTDPDSVGHRSRFYRVLAP